MSGDRYLIRDQNAKQFLTFIAIDWDYKKIYCQTDLAWLELQNCNKFAGVNSSSLQTRTRVALTPNYFVHYSENDIIDNIDQNKRNGNQGDHLFDTPLNKCRFVIERTNAWLDAFKALLVRFETNDIHWKALNLLAFCIILLRQL